MINNELMVGDKAAVLGYNKGNGVIIPEKLIFNVKIL
jgi:hypothetical protein